MTAREQSTSAAASPYAAACDLRDSLTPQQAAKAAWYPGHPLSEQQIADLVARHRAEARAKQGSTKAA